MAPVATYGVELFAWSDADCKSICAAQQSGLRRLLNLGGRSPGEIAPHLAGIHSCIIEWRVRRVALLLRLLNSPPDSLQHLGARDTRALEVPVAGGSAGRHASSASRNQPKNKYFSLRPASDIDVQVVRCGRMGVSTTLRTTTR